MAATAPEAAAAEKDPAASPPAAVTPAEAPAEVKAPAEAKAPVDAKAPADAKEPAAAEAEPAAAEEPAVEESTYGLAVEPEAAFEAARAAARQLHACLDRLQAGKARLGEEADGSLGETARTMQLQLLALRRAHRAMAKAADAGRAVEAAARRAADAEHANLETRAYESACCRAAARRCRSFPAPQLTRLRPLLEGAEEGEEDDDEEDDVVDSNGTASKGLAARLETERAKRTSLFAELEALEQQKAKDLEAFREVTKVTDELFTRLRTVEQALEPVCDLLPFRPRPAHAAAPSTNGVSQLSPPLQVVHAKFEVLSAFGSKSKVSVCIEGSEDGPPPEKRAKVEGGSAAAPSPAVVCVLIASAEGPKALLRFASPHRSLVTVSFESEGGEAVLEGLWPGDDGRSSGLVAMLPGGDGALHGWPYGWAQILAGLRDTLLVEAPSLQQAEGVTAADVVHRVCARLAKKAEA